MTPITQILTATPLFAPEQVDSLVPSRSAPAAALYPADILATAADAFPGWKRLDGLSDVRIGADRNYLVGELDAADKLAGLAFLCLQEGNVARAQQLMQEATDIRKAVAPNLTPSQQQSLDKIMNLQKDAFEKIQNAGGSIFKIFQKIAAQIELGQAAEESQKLRNSILSTGQLQTHP
jgi:hypothetical protein